MMIPVDETALWTAIEALDNMMESLAETMEYDEDEQSKYADYETARLHIMRQILMQQIRVAQSAQNN